MLINLGSGQRKFGTPEHPWINVDTNPKWEPDVVADGANMPMFEDGSAEIICLHHCLEHLPVEEAAAMLKECYRVLRPGGSLIICIPHLKELAKAWLRGQISDYIYIVNLYGAYMDHEADRHKWGYSRESLESFLKTHAPWESVTPFDWRQIPGSEIAVDFWIMGEEAVK